MDTELADIIEQHKKNVEKYRTNFSGNKFDIVPVSVNVAIVDMIQDKTISKATGLKLLDFYFVLHKIKMGIESKEDVKWLLEFLKINDQPS